MAASAETIGELVEPLVAAAGLELWDVEVNPRAVRVLVDRPGGVDLDALSALSRGVSACLDGHDELTPGPGYQLEVSSPGVERTLRHPRQFQRFLGSIVAVKADVAIGPADARRVQGLLSGADDDGITVDGPDGPAAISYEHIQKARTVLAWGAGRR